MSSDLDTCGCEGESTDTEVYNAAGLSEIAWRIGTWSSFYSRMKAAIPSTEVGDSSPVARPLDTLTTRASDDPTIALLDAVACVLDVLTFYQERIANEGFLRTATEDRSVQELARMVGYNRAPGMAATTLLAFTVQDSEGAPGESTVYAGTQVVSVPGQGETAQTFEVSEELYCHKDWNTLTPQLTTPHTLDRASKFADNDDDYTVLLLSGVDLRLKAGDMLGFQLGPKFSNNPHTQNDSIQIASVSEDRTNNLTIVTLQQPIAESMRSAGDLKSTVRVFVFRSLMYAFGYNAPTIRLDESASPQEWVQVTTGLVFDDDNVAHLAGENKEIVPDSLVAMEGSSVARTMYAVRSVGTTPYAVPEYALSGMTTALGFSDVPPTDLDDYDDVRDFRMWVQSEELFLAEVPVDDTVPVGDAVANTVIVEGEIEPLPEGRTLLFIDSIDPSKYETGTVKTCTPKDGYSEIVLDGALDGRYTRTTVKIYGNVAEATHGESISRTLGNGDGAEANQAFTIPTAPLTHVLAESGTESSLVVTVGDVQWTGVSSFYEQEATAQVYTQHLDEDGYTVVTFGDGVVGARLPTGTSNVKASWRTGLGEDGNVSAGKLTQMRSRPLGMKAVTNPLDAVLGEDPEALEDMRTNAPLQAVTLERLVSVTDYAAYANAFAGMGIARADMVRVGGRRTIVLTAFDTGGKSLATSVQGYLEDGIAPIKDAAAVVRVVTGTWLPFTVDLKVMFEEDTDADESTVIAALSAAFAWTEREFGQGVTTSEVMAVVQAVAGVRMVIVDHLYSWNPAFTTSTGWALVEESDNRLNAPGVQVAGTKVTGASMLVFYEPESSSTSERRSSITPLETR